VVGEEVVASAEILKPGATPEDGDPATQEDHARAAVGPEASFVRHSAVMSVGTALSRLTGFLRVAAMAFALGVAESRLADAYNVANTTPNIIYELALGGILSSVFIPVFVEWLQSRGRDEAWHTARAVMTFAVVSLGAIMVVGILASGLVIRLYTFRVTGPEREAAQALASFFLKWFMPQIVFYGLGAVATGLLNAHRRFAAPMFAPVLNNLIVSATFFGFAALPGPGEPTTSGITDAQRYLLAVGTTLGVFGMTVALWPPLRRLGFRWRWTLDLADAGLRRIARLAGWAFLYVVVNQVGYLIVIVFAAGVQGGYTAYAAAFIFFQLPHAIFAVSIMTALLPSLSGHWARGDVAAFRAQLSQGIRATAFIVVPAAFGYLALAVPIVRLLLEHGVTERASSELVARVLFAFSLGLFSFSAFQLLLRAFYAMQDTRTPAFVKIATVAFQTALNFILFRYLRVEGLALAHAIAYTIAAIAGGAILRRRVGGLEGRRLASSLARIGVAGAATGGAAFIAAKWAGDVLGGPSATAQLVPVIAGVAAGLAAFLATSLLLRIEELAVIRRLVLTRVRRP
jgi:putative peptidoglycan lipid II flippase